MKSTFLAEPDSEGAAVLGLSGILPAEVSFVGDSMVLPIPRRVGRKIDFKPWKVGNLELKLGLVGLETIDGIAGSGFEAGMLEDLAGLESALVGSGGRGRMDFVLSDRTKPTCLGGEDDGSGPSDDEAIISAASNDLTLFERGTKGTLPGEARGILAVFERACEDLVGVINDAASPLLGRGRVDGFDTAYSSSFTAARPADTSPKMDFRLFAGASFPG